MMRVNCPGCGKLLQCDPGPSGKKIACPSCRRMFAVSPPAEAITTVEPISGPREEDILEVLPGDGEPSGPARLAHQFVRGEGLDAREVFDGEVADEREAATLLSEWRQEMPEVPSAYTPSGVLPAPALVLMIVGSLAGAVAGLLAGAIIAAIGGAIVALIAYLIALLLFCGFIWYFIIIIGFILALLAAAGTFAATGWMSAWCTTRFGHGGKNRNVRAAVVLSVLSAALAIVLAFVIYYFAGKPLLADRGMADYSDIIAAVVAVIGGAIAALVAGVIAAEQVRADKFCESCEEYMTAVKQRTLCVGGLRTLVRALGENRIDVAAGVLHGPPGESGELKLFACPSCSCGFLEATARYKAQWKEKKDKKEKEESWLAASRQLAAADVEKLREQFSD